MMKERMPMHDHIRHLILNDIAIDIFEDDLYLPFFGGNKARKIISLENEIIENEYNAIVTTGGIQSNHCRVSALFAAQMKMQCTLVLHGSKEEFNKAKGNALLMRMTGAEIVFVESAQIGLAMDTAMKKYAEHGYNPYYLYGGGHNKQGVEAYIEITIRLFSKMDVNLLPLHIFLASGTGSTQAGIIIGLKQLGLDHKIQVHGISVGREKQNGINAIKHAISLVDGSLSEIPIYFYNSYLFGGYGIGKERLMPYITNVAMQSGLILDPTYTGKAFYGMVNLIKKLKISGKIMFWHTGGILNLME